MATHDDGRDSSAATVAFERDLEALVLEAFANGARIEGTWEIRPRPTTIPDWTVEVGRRTATDDEADETPSED